MNGLDALATGAIALLQQYGPWVAASVAEAAIDRGVGEIWELVKGKLKTAGGQEAIEKAAREPEKERNWELVRLHLLEALEADGELRTRLAELVGARGAGGVRQTVVGDSNKVIAVVSSPGTKIG